MLLLGQLALDQLMAVQLADDTFATDATTIGSAIGNAASSKKGRFKCQFDLHLLFLITFNYALLSPWRTDDRSPIRSEPRSNS